MKKSLLILILVVVLAGIAVYAFTRDRGASVTSEDSNQETVTENSDPSTPTTPDEPEPFEVAYIRAVREEGGVRYLDLDYAEFISDDVAAKQAALADKQCTDLEACAPNGFYIRNQDKAVTRLALSRDASFGVIAFDRENTIEETINYGTFQARFRIAPERWELRPFRVEKAGNEITAMEEVYVP